MTRRRRLVLAAAGLLAVVALPATAIATGWAQSARDWLRWQQTPQLDVPEGWPHPTFDARHDPVTRDGFELGRRLFYDPILSQDGSISCASCHQQFAAFAHYDHPVSHGLHGANGTRNAPGLFNLAWQPGFMWDGGITSLERQPLAPLENPVEMGATLPQTLDRLRADARYRREFRAAFGPGDSGEDIDSSRLLRALAQFLSTMVSAGSRFDARTAGHGDFSAAETRGLQAFTEHCSGCHAAPLFTDHAYRSDGVRSADAGRELITGQAADRGLFRVPSLRNVALTAPYMHDGRFDTLEQVLAHYRGLASQPIDDPRLRAASAISAQDADDIVAFLGTLSDPAFTHDPRFAESAAR